MSGSVEAHAIGKWIKLYLLWNPQPKFWLEQKTQCEVFAVQTDSEEWKLVASQFKRSLPSAEIQQITRNQNIWLFEGYQFHKQRINKKNGGHVNEIMLFYGNKNTNPEIICKSEDGIDQRFYTKGKWGIGAYFTKEALHAHGYAYEHDDGSQSDFGYSNSWILQGFWLLQLCVSHHKDQ